eukprot:TRINITY_DN7516_c0_g1_i1.p1 TRINITY_DN7516_c0_g1~~TRINITY_DN7516_c0_g1_i1.p1  ORF type:complete len:419 (+),score=75.04 TRINITY_DN7516_c0_g1_i1:969-2225(+)
MQTLWKGRLPPRKNNIFQWSRGRSFHESTNESESDLAGVTPQSVYVEGGVDYDKLVHRFGSHRIGPDLKQRIEVLTGKKIPHLLQRDIFFSHRDLEKILDSYQKGEKFYLYTGRGPSSIALHMGHLIPFIFTAQLQKLFDVPVVIQITDDEKYLYRGLEFEELKKNTIENCKDILACGFDPEKTFIFTNTSYIQHLFPNILRIQRLFSINEVRATFGLDQTDNIGKMAFPATQAAPSFRSSFPEVLSRYKPGTMCLIPCGIDQDPYFRMTRHYASRLGPNHPKPALLHSKFFPSLQGISAKMSASIDASAVFMTDDQKKIKKKLQSAYTGGGASIELHRANGANLETDVPYQYLKFFLEDQTQLDHIAQEYSSGRMLSGEIKKIVVDTIGKVIGDHQTRRNQITDEHVQGIMKIRSLR